MADYQSYLNNYLQNIQPAIAQQMRNLKATYADRGLSNTTAGQGSITQQRGLLQSDAYLKGNEYAENARQYDSTLGENRRQYDTTFGEGQRQYNQNFGESKRQYNATLAAAEAKRLQDAAARRADQALAATQAQWQANTDLISLAGKTTPKQATYNSTYKKIMAGLPIGDPMENEGIDQAFADTQARDAEYAKQYQQGLAQAFAQQEQLGSMSMDDRYGTWNTQEYEDGQRQMSLAKMNEKLEREKMALQNRQFQQSLAASQAEAEKAKAGVDPYSTIYSVYAEQLKEGKNTMFGTDFIAYASGATGTDILADARSGNPRAVNILKLFWPKSWQKKLGNEQPAVDMKSIFPNAGIKPAHGFHSTHAAKLDNPFANQIVSKIRSIENR